MSRASGNLEPKIRGANRSTKAAGKLKVLPEQPELTSLHGESLKDREQSPSTCGDSDEGDVDESSEEQEDIEVCGFSAHHAVRDSIKDRFIIKSR